MQARASSQSSSIGLNLLAALPLSHRRGGGLRWYSRDTGSVWGSPGQEIQFGVNQLGLINVYARDLARLSRWQLRAWAGHNVTPDGAVSTELLDAQLRTRPAGTEAPETRLPQVMDELDAIFREWVGAPIFKGHEAAEEIFQTAHRFRAIDRNGLLALAKDVARLTADRIDRSALRKVVAPSEGENWRSLKSLEKALATVISEDQARTALTPLVGVYELRLGDAHLPSGEIEKAFVMVGIEPGAVLVEQGRQLLEGAVGALRAVQDALAPLVGRYQG